MKITVFSIQSFSFKKTFSFFNAYEDGNSKQVTDDCIKQWFQECLRFQFINFLKLIDEFREV